MAAEFIARLQRVEASSLDDGDRNCFICRAEYGTQFSDSGVQEHAVRLPCGHLAGSECIGLWLKDIEGRNLCPLCQKVLFEIPVIWYENGQYWLGDERISEGLEIMSGALRQALESVGPHFWQTHSQGGDPLLDRWLHFLDREVEDRLVGENPDGMFAKSHQSRQQRERALYDTLNNNGAFAVRWDVPGAFPAHDQGLSVNQANDLLSPKQEIALFEELERMGAFRGFWDNQARWQMWTLLRITGWAYELGEGDGGIWKRLDFRVGGDLVRGSG